MVEGESTSRDIFRRLLRTPSAHPLGGVGRMRLEGISHTSLILLEFRSLEIKNKKYAVLRNLMEQLKKLKKKETHKHIYCTLKTYLP